MIAPHSAPAAEALCMYRRMNFIFLFRNLVKPSEMPRPLALTGITAHTQKHFTSSDKTQKKRRRKKKKKKIYIHI